MHFKNISRTQNWHELYMLYTIYNRCVHGLYIMIIKNNHFLFLALVFERKRNLLKKTCESFKDLLPNFHVSIKLWAQDFYLNNRVFLSMNYQLILAPQKFDLFKIYICYNVIASFKDIKFPRGNDQTDSSKT